MLREEKETIVAELAEQLRQTQTLIVADYRGLTMKEIDAQDKSNTLLVPHSPGALPDFFEQIRNAIMIGDTAANKAKGAGV